MKITDIELKNYYWEKKIPIRNGKHTYTHIGMQLVEIKNDEGQTGIGWGITTSLGMMTVAIGFLEHFKPYIINQDPFNYRRIWNNLWQPKIIGRRGISTRIISAIDILMIENVNGVLDIGTGHSHNLVDIIDYFKIDCENKIGGENERLDNKADITTLNRLGWKPQKNLYDYIKENRNVN